MEVEVLALSEAIKEWDEVEREIFESLFNYWDYVDIRRLPEFIKLTSWHWKNKERNWIELKIPKEQLLQLKIGEEVVFKPYKTYGEKIIRLSQKFFAVIGILVCSDGTVEEEVKVIYEVRD